MRHWINLIESYYRNAKYISITEDNGSIEGYVVATASDNIQDWLCSRHKKAYPNFKTDVSKYQKIAFLNNINVDENSRGMGLGNRLLGEFIEEAESYGAEAIFLMAYLDDPQKDGFDLVKWYQKWGFVIVPNTGPSNPLMVKII